MPTTSNELVSRARSRVANLTADQVMSAASQGAPLVGLREPAEPHRPSSRQPESGVTDAARAHPHLTNHTSHRGTP